MCQAVVLACAYLCGAIWLPLNGTVGLDVPVDGDVALLELIAKSQAAHREAMFQGSWEGDVTSDGANGKIKIEWKGESRRIEFDIVHNLEFGGDPINGIAVRSRHRQAIFIRNLLIAIDYDGLGRSLPTPADFVPAEQWFSYDNYLPIERLLDSKFPQGDVRQFVVKDIGEVVEVKRIHADDSTLKMNFSKALGLNLIHYEWLALNSDEQRIEGEAKWKQLPSGEFFPEEFRVWTYFTSKGRGKPVFESITRSFSPTTSLVERDFLFSGLDLPPGTEIQRMTAVGELKSREFVGGDRGKRLRALNALAELLRNDPDSTLKTNSK